MKFQSIVLFALPILAACAVNDPTFTRANTSSAEASEAYQQCLYQAELATANTGALPPKYKGTIGDAVQSGVADGIARGYEQGNLVNHCMKMQGFTKSK